MYKIKIFLTNIMSIQEIEKQVNEFLAKPGIQAISTDICTSYVLVFYVEEKV